MRKRRALQAGVIGLLLGVLPARTVVPTHAAVVWYTTAAITHFDESGATYYGYQTTEGETFACSWDLPALAKITLPDGTTGYCEDRGGGLDTEAAEKGVDSAVDVYCPGCWWVDANDGPTAIVRVEIP